MPSRPPAFRPPRLRKKPRPAGHNAHYLTPQWKALRQTILVRDAYTCADCRRVVVGLAAQVDHILALKDGGTDAPENLAVRCNVCHGRKIRDEQRRRS
jgi:5-methylcytosine-specific restriction endonuclease McrA